MFHIRARLFQFQLALGVFAQFRARDFSKHPEITDPLFVCQYYSDNTFVNDCGQGDRPVLFIDG